MNNKPYFNWLNYVFSLLLCLPGVAGAVTVLQPGQSKNDFAFESQPLTGYAWEWIPCTIAKPFDTSCHRSAIGLGGEVAVGFSTDNTNMKLYTSVNTAITHNRQEARAEGIIYTDFCLEGDTPGSCNNSTSSSNVATVNFEVSWAGTLFTLGPTTNSWFVINCMVIDTTTGKLVSFKEMVNTSVGNLFGSYQKVGKITIPAPDTDGIEKTQPVVFNLPLIKGHVYRFQIQGVTASNAIFYIDPIEASTNFLDPLSLGGRDWSGIKIENFSVDVAPSATSNEQEISNLKQLINSLQESVADLAAKIDSNDARTMDQMNSIKQGNDALIARVETLETQQATSNAQIKDLQDQMATLGKLINAMRHHREKHERDDRKMDEKHNLR